MRFMPVEGVCYAGLEEISKLGKKLLPEHFPTGDDVEPVSVCIMLLQSCPAALWLFHICVMAQLPRC